MLGIPVSKMLWLYLQVRPPMPFVHFFLIDVSYNAVTWGALEATCSAIARILDELQGVARYSCCFQRFCYLLAFNQQPAVSTAQQKTCTPFQCSYSTGKQPSNVFPTLTLCNQSAWILSHFNITWCCFRAFIWFWSILMPACLSSTAQQLHVHGC